MIQHIRESCGLSSIKGGPTTLFEDNVACIAQFPWASSRNEGPTNVNLPSEFGCGKVPRVRGGGC